MSVELRETVVSQRETRSGAIVVEAETLLPTRHGSFRFMVFHSGEDRRAEHIAIVAGDVRALEDEVLVRVHSECITSEVFGSLKCDCAEQLEAALARLGATGRGVVLYLRQEGRGIGLANKIRAYALQEQGLDTVDANRALGLPDDARQYVAAADMLRFLGVARVRLITNNPEKVDALTRLGIAVRGREPSLIPANPHSAGYLTAKRSRMRHLLHER